MIGTTYVINENVVPQDTPTVSLSVGEAGRPRLLQTDWASPMLLRRSP